MRQFENISACESYLSELMLSNSLGQPTNNRDQRFKTIASITSSLGLDLFDEPVIKVAGTNGKGSFVQSLAHVLQSKGYRVGIFTSPHIIKINERIAINTEMINDEDFCNHFTQIVHKTKSYQQTVHFFDLLLWTALQYFKQQTLDFILLEVGVGGRLDTVNTVQSEYAVITSIGLDHQDLLGHSKEAIATEKCGIISENSIFLNLETAPPQPIKTQLNQTQSLSINRDFVVSMNGSSVKLYDKKAKTQYQFEDHGLSPYSLAGAIIFATQVLALPIIPAQLPSLLQGLKFKGRFEQHRLPNQQKLIIDIAHNAQAAILLKQRLNAITANRRIMILGIKQDKPIDPFIDAISGSVDAWFLYKDERMKLHQPESIAEVLRGHDEHMISVSKNILQAYARAKQLAGKKGLIVITGTFMGLDKIYRKLESSKDAIFE